MKKLIVILLFAVFTASAFTQGLFRPLPDNLFKTNMAALNAPQNVSVWIPRLSAGVVANQFTYNKETKNLDMTSFSKVGLGISYAHYIPINDAPYNNFSVNGFLFFPTNESGLSLVVSVSALQYVSIGAGYDIKLKQVFALTGITYTF
jgi:hypothetical protein